MSKVLAGLGQLVLFAVFVALFFGGGLLGLFHLDPFGAPHWFVSHSAPTSTRYFVPTGLLLMCGLWVVVVGIEAAGKRLRGAGLWTTVAFVGAVVVGVALKFGWVDAGPY
jgi:hypothetical protein